MSSPASVAKHPIHPMLIPLPIGLWVFSLACDIAFRLGAGPLWSDMAFWSMVGGLIGAGLAAGPGLIDFLSIRDPDAWRVGVLHMSINLTIVILYLVNVGLRFRYPPDALAPFVLSIVSVSLLLVSGWLGWALVYEHRVGLPSEAEIAIAARKRDHAA